MTSLVTDFDTDGEGATTAREAHAAKLGRPFAAYLYPPNAKLAVRVALATGRPLLLRGAAGSGKSTLAEDVAVCLGWPYYERVVTSRTEARDLLSQLDAVRRLGDAHVRRKGANPKVLTRYIQPGVLWWAFDPKTAARRGARRAAERDLATDPAAAQGRSGPGAVVLLDEIDKAEPDMPNDLLVPLGAGRFTVPEIDLPVERQRQVLVVITTNEERELPGAFVRRCIVFELPKPDHDRLRDIVKAHFPDVDEDLLSELLSRFIELRKAAEDDDQRPPSTAELLDAVGACVALQIRRGAEAWVPAMRATLWKRHDDPGEPDPMAAPASKKGARPASPETKGA